MQLLLEIRERNGEGIKISMIFGRLMDMVYCVTRWAKVMIVRKCLFLLYSLAQKPGINGHLEVCY